MSETRGKTLGDMSADFQAGYRAGLRADLAERNRIARECAEAHGETEDVRRELAEVRDLLSIRDDDLDTLREEFERVTGRDWTAEQARSWSS